LKHIYLTDKGYECAVKTYEKHVFFTNLLINLGLEKDAASDEARLIEHAVSDQTFEKIKNTYNKLPCGQIGFCPGVRKESHDDYGKKHKRKSGAEVKTKGAAPDAAIS
jgi:Mn-dependent DtxR family transcriptional regulator